MKKEFYRYLSYIVLNTFAGSHLCPMRIRRLIFKWFGHRIGTVFPGYFIGVGNGKLSIGRNSFCNYRCFFDMSNDITIGNSCSIAFGVTFCTSYHDIGGPLKRAGGGKNASIIVEDGCWIGANVTILSGVTIAKGCIVGACSLVSKSTEPNGLYVGVPAIRIRELE